MNLVRNEPVLTLSTVISTIVVMFFTYCPGIHLTPTGLAAVATITTAVLGIAAAFLVRPVNLAVIGAAVSTVLVAATAFGLHLQANQIAAVSSGIMILLGYLLREKVSPLSAAA